MNFFTEAVKQVGMTLTER